MTKRLYLLGLLLIMLVVNTGCIFHSTKPNAGVRTKKIDFLVNMNDQTIYAPRSTYLFLPFINDWHVYNINLQNMEMTHCY